MISGLERVDLQRLLFRTAFCVMACDGHIDDKEVGEIRSMNESSVYFQGIDLSAELDELLSDLREKGTQIVDDLFSMFGNSEISPVQELLILEIAFRMVNADDKTHENEIRFLRVLRSKLRLHDQIIRDRFGSVEYLVDTDYTEAINKEKAYTDLFASLTIPNFDDFSSSNFTNSGKH